MKIKVSKKLLTAYALLIVAWLVVAVVDIMSGAEAGYITPYFILGLFEIVILLYFSNLYHRTIVNGLNLFLACSLIFIYVVPYISTFLDYVYILAADEIDGVKNLIRVNFWATLVFFIGYTGSYDKHLSPAVRSGKRVNYYHILLIFAFAVIGTLSFLNVTSILSISGLSYSNIGVAMMGQGWVIRFGELLGLSGLLAVLMGYDAKNKWLMRYGFAALIAFAYLRLPFQNRENVVKFFIIAVLALQLRFSLKYKRSTMLFVAVLAVSVLLMFPFLSALRGNDSVASLAGYVHYFVRDLNFAEIASTLLATPEYNSAIGLEGIWNTVSMVVPRQIWPEKGFTVAVEVTSWLTPVPYNPSEPAFAYAPTYIGYAYVIAGYPFIVLMALFMGFLTGRFASTARRSAIDAAISALIIYYITFSLHKLDPGNVITALIIPLIALSISRFLDRATLRKDMGQRV